MKKVMNVTFGYEHWAMSPEDAITLMAIFTRSTKIEHVEGKWSGPMKTSEDQTPPVSSVTWAVLEEPVAEPQKANAYLEAARSVG